MVTARRCGCSAERRLRFRGPASSSIRSIPWEETGAAKNKTIWRCQHDAHGRCRCAWVCSARVGGQRGSCRSRASPRRSGCPARPRSSSRTPVRLRKVLGISTAESLELSPVPWLARYSYPVFSETVCRDRWLRSYSLKAVAIPGLCCFSSITGSWLPADRPGVLGSAGRAPSCVQQGRCREGAAALLAAELGGLRTPMVSTHRCACVGWAGCRVLGGELLQLLQPLQLWLTQVTTLTWTTGA